MTRALSTFCVSIDDTLLGAANAINRNKSRGVLVISCGKVVGVISEGDILRHLLNGVDIMAPVRNLFNMSFEYLSTRDMAEASKILRRLGAGFVPVVNKDMELVDVLTIEEVFAFLSENN